MTDLSFIGPVNEEESIIEPEINPEHTQAEIKANKRIRQIGWIVIGIIVVFLLGLGGGYLRWGQDETAEARQKEEATRIYEQISPKDGYNLLSPTAPWVLN